MSIVVLSDKSPYLSDKSDRSDESDEAKIYYR